MVVNLFLGVLIGVLLTKLYYKMYPPNETVVYVDSKDKNGAEAYSTEEYPAGFSARGYAAQVELDAAIDREELLKAQHRSRLDLDDNIRDDYEKPDHDYIDGFSDTMLGISAVERSNMTTREYLNARQNALFKLKGYTRDAYEQRLHDANGLDYTRISAERRDAMQKVEHAYERALDAWREEVFGEFDETAYDHNETDFRQKRQKY